MFGVRGRRVHRTRKKREYFVKGRERRERKDKRKRVTKGNMCLGSEEEEWTEEGRREGSL